MNSKIVPLILILLFSAIILSPVSFSQNISNPPWAFKNAYLQYNATTKILGISENLSVKYTIINIYENNGTFIYFENFSSFKYKFLYENLTETGNFSNPNGFPAFSTSDLNYLNQGRIPSDIKNSVKGVVTNVNINVPAGSYVTDKIIGNDGSTVYVDMSTGIIVYENITFFGLNTTMKLTKTNISNMNFNIIYIILAAIALILIFVALIHHTRKR